MSINEALQRADTFGPIQSYPPDGDGPALTALAAEVRQLQSKNATLREALLTIYGGLPYVVTEAKDIASRALEETK
jgi:hypothetical protein